MQFLAQPATADATRAAIAAAEAEPVARELVASEPVGQPAPLAPAGAAAPALRDGNSALGETDAAAPVPAPENGAARRREADVLKLLRDEEKVFTLPAGELLFREGDPAGRMYVVRSGSLRIQNGGAGDEEVGSGGIVGEMGLVDKHLPRSTSAYALTECELVEVDARRFKALIEQQPGFAITVMQVLTRRLRHLSEPAKPARPGP